ncbi:hypothetical protein ACHAW5_006190 [Stephanodiscus triporus]|uniref:Acetyl-coenzyme A carboxylase carboxyl transferase subunit beta domain-containing protein n=1 Tax=Stephanodiscus triporus TaxID=2934178 RepID=A0ABD3MP46_9STRA
MALDADLEERVCQIERQEVMDAIHEREQALLPVYEQIAVKFCELHDTPGRMKAVGVIELNSLRAGSLRRLAQLEALWTDDKAVLSWMAQQNEQLEMKMLKLSRENVVQEVFEVMTAGGNTAKVATAGIVEGISQALLTLSAEEQAYVKDLIKSTLKL